MASETVAFTVSMAQEYLRPPGDSVRLQHMINDPMTRMARAAVTLQQVTTVIIEIDPTEPYVEPR
jgi:ethanolamine utilization microcompartment shell protein EutS